VVSRPVIARCCFPGVSTPIGASFGHVFHSSFSTLKCWSTGDRLLAAAFFPDRLLFPFLLFHLYVNTHSLCFCDILSQFWTSFYACPPIPSDRLSSPVNVRCKVAILRRYSQPREKVAGAPLFPRSSFEKATGSPRFSIPPAREPILLQVLLIKPVSSEDLRLRRPPLSGPLPKTQTLSAASALPLDDPTRLLLQGSPPI